MARNLTDYLPQESAVIIQMENPDLFFSNLRNNEFVKQNNENSLVRDLKKRLSVLEYFPHQNEALLVLSPEGIKDFHFTFITRGKLTPRLDSVINKKVVTKTQGDLEIKEYDLENKKGYATQIDSISILSSSVKLIEELTSGKKIVDADLQTAFKAASRKKASVIINHKRSSSFLGALFPDGFSHFSNWSVLDTDISQTAIALNGISIATDSIPHMLNAFKDTGLAKNNLAQITPVNAREFTSVTFTEFEKFLANLTFLRDQPSDLFSEEIDMLKSASEVGVIDLTEGVVFAIQTPDPESARNSLNIGLEPTEDYRGFTIFDYPNHNSFQELLQPLLNPKELHYFTFLDTYILFASTSESLKTVISAVQNEAVLSNTEAYISASENLSSDASILVVRNNRSESKKEDDHLDFTNFPITALQFIYQDNFAHVHAILTKSTDLNTSSTPAQSTKIELGSNLVTTPVFFKNHRTNGLDIVVQDLQNMLYLISPEGRIYWKKQLDSRILGEVEAVDILRNGRYQLAFVTQNELHIIDRDGNPVKPFPLKFRDDITQPLAVFDYDNKKDYRFLIVQDKDLFMYDRKGRNVKGFNFSGTASTITQTPKHIRIGRKDYIVIPETSGNLNILNRTGEVRVAVKENLDLTRNKWYEYKGDFVSSNNSGQLIKINVSGKIDREDWGLAENHRITATERTLVSLSENELKIKENAVTLDFGLYTEPQIFVVNNKIYVSVTDLQAQKVYLFDSNAKLLDGFPVYGTSAIDLANADKDPALELVVQGGDNEVLIYEVR